MAWYLTEEQLKTLRETITQSGWPQEFAEKFTHHTRRRGLPDDVPYENLLDEFKTFTPTKSEIAEANRRLALLEKLEGAMNKAASKAPRDRDWSVS